MGGGPQKWGAPVHLHTLHIPKATTGRNLETKSRKKLKFGEDGLEIIQNFLKENQRNSLSP